MIAFPPDVTAGRTTVDKKEHERPLAQQAISYLDRRCECCPNAMASNPCCEQCRARGVQLLCREQLYADLQPLVRRLIRQYGRDDSDLRQDLAGEIYCCFVRLLDAYDPERGIPIRPYLVRQLTASMYTYARRQWRSNRRELSMEEIAPGGDPCGGEDPTSAWDDAMEFARIAQVLPRAIRHLPDRQRKSIVWRYYDEKSYEEIAVLLSIQPATVRSLVRHGINNMRRWVHGQGVTCD